MWVHHTHDSSLWPSQGTVYPEAVLRAQGESGAAERFRLRWTENAEHVGPLMLPNAPGRAAASWLIDYQPVIEQSLLDLIDWVERGIDPAVTEYSYADGKVTLPDTAAERRGIQPVVHVTANGGVRAEVRVGEPVTLQVTAEVPPGAGTVIQVEWDFDGTGTFPSSDATVDGTAARVDLTTTHTYDGDAQAVSRRIPNLAQVRVVVV
jgi:hypothetical protein